MKCSAKDLDGQVVVPGDVITTQVLDLIGNDDKAKLGPGLRQDSGEIMCCKSGILRYKQPNVVWVDGHQKRYVPVRGENVIGVIVGKAGDLHKVDIGCSDQVLLNSLSFEGATKRYRPVLANGDVVFGKLIVANKDMEPEMSCVDQNTGKANGMGVVPNDGYLFTVSLNLVRKILSPDCVLLPLLGSLFAFEAIIGLNGKIHLTGRNANHIIAIMNMIVSAEYMTNDQIRESLNNTEENFR